MTTKELVLDALKRIGKTMAEETQSKSADMTGTELNEVKHYVPNFKTACEKMNMLNRPIGFVCKSSEGRVVKLLQPYDSTIYTDEPELLPAQWGFVWSNDKRHALPFIALSTSPYMVGNCCTENGNVYESKIDNNVHSPSAYPDGWELVAQEVM